MQIPDNVKIVAYEPVFAIGTGNPDTPQNAKNIAKTIKQKGIDIVLYGGSVSGANVKSFLEKNLIDGVLVGSSSLEASDFLKIVESSK
jgi:triosephosphate isomerase (TIM)